jgi:hypothetical protein
MRFSQIISILVLLLAIGNAHANLIVDGSFEDAKVASGTYKTLYSLSGWVVGSNGIELRDNLAGTAESGANFAELDTTANSWISQTVSTVVGQAYELTFYAAARSGVAASSSGILATISSGKTSASQAVVLDGMSSIVTWTKYTLDFIAAASTTTVRFAATGTSDSYGGSLDNVALVPVPEPSDWSMLLAGLGLLGWVSRRKAPSGD